MGEDFTGSGRPFLEERTSSFLLRCPKFCGTASPLQNFDRCHSSRSLFPPQAAVALVPL